VLAPLPVSAETKEHICFSRRRLKTGGLKKVAERSVYLQTKTGAKLFD
jgi:hypothetical protein